MQVEGVFQAALGFWRTNEVEERLLIGDGIGAVLESHGVGLERVHEQWGGFIAWGGFRRHES